MKYVERGANKSPSIISIHSTNKHTKLIFNFITKGLKY